MKVINRRMFLMGAGGAALAIPRLPSLLPREAHAAPSPIPKRYVAIWSNYDYGHPRHWYPTLGTPGGTIGGQTLTKAGEAPVHYRTLRSLLSGRSSLSRVLGPALTPHVDSLNVLRGLDSIEYFGHGFAHNHGNLPGTVSNGGLTGLPSIPTLDQVLGRNRTFNPVASEPYLLGTGGGSVSWGPNGSGNVVRKSTMADTPEKIYQTLFRGGAAPEAGETTVPNPRADVLSRVLDDYRSVRNGSQISALDRTVLDNAMDKLSDVHRNLTARATSGCSYKKISRSHDGSTYDDAATLRNMADLLVAAMMCDLNRAFHFTAEIADAYYNKSSEDFHNGHSHQPQASVAGVPNHQYMADIQGQLVTNFIAPLLDGMASAVDPVNGKSILYNSIVHFSMENGTVHAFSDVPVLLAGNAGGALTSGHMVDYTNPDNWDGAFNLPVEGGWSAEPGSANWCGYGHGVPFQRVFNNVLQGLGLAPADYERTDINRWYVNRTDGALGARNNGIQRIGGYGHVGLEDPRTSGWESYGHHRYHDYDLRYFKDPLPLPTASAA